MSDTSKVLSEYKDRHDLATVANLMGLPYSSLARILNEHDHYDLGVSKIIPFIVASDYDFTLLDHIESHLGRVAIPIHPGTHGQLDLEGLRRFAKESGHALHELSQALDDGIVDKTEASRCLKELSHLAQICMVLITHCHKALEAEK